MVAAKTQFLPCHPATEQFWGFWAVQRPW